MAEREHLARGRVDAREERPQGGAVHGPGKSERLGGASEPAPVGLDEPARVLATGRKSREVVLLPAPGELRDTEHSTWLRRRVTIEPTDPLRRPGNITRRVACLPLTLLCAFGQTVVSGTADSLDKGSSGRPTGLRGPRCQPLASLCKNGLADRLPLCNNPTRGLSPTLAPAAQGGSDGFYRR